jgi:SMC interacting uncharacterized protein involved in chromosome segregation
VELSKPNEQMGLESPAEKAGHKIREIRERLRKKTPDDSAVPASVDDLEIQLEQYFGQHGGVKQGPRTQERETVMNPSQRQVMDTQGVSTQNIRAKVVERVVDRMLDDLERSGPSISDEIFDQMVERVLHQFKASH